MGVAAGVNVSDSGERAALTLRGGQVKVLQQKGEGEWAVKYTVPVESAIPAVIQNDGCLWTVATNRRTIAAHKTASEPRTFPIPDDAPNSETVSLEAVGDVVVVVLANGGVIWLELHNGEIRISRQAKATLTVGEGRVSKASWTTHDTMVFVTSGPDVVLRHARLPVGDKCESESSVLLLRRTKSSKALVASLAAFDEYAVVLFVGGELRILKQGINGKFTVKFTRQFTSPDPDHPLAKLAVVTKTASPYFAVAYGKHLSFWDTIYGVGHQYSTLPRETDPNLASLGFAMDIDLEPEDEKEGSFIAAATNNKSVHIRSKIPQLTLQLVTTDAEACQDILETDCIPSPPMGARPDLRKAIVALAAGGAAEPLRRVIEEEDERDLGLFERLFQPEFDISSVSLNELLGLEANSDIQVVPSERVASAAAVRILVEMDKNPSSEKYSTMLIELFGRGVLSWNALRATLLASDELADKYDNALDVILAAPKPAKAIASYVSRVRDVPESEIVRALSATLLSDELLPTVDTIVTKAEFDRRTLVGCLKAELPVNSASKLVDWLTRRYNSADAVDQGARVADAENFDLQNTYFPSSGAVRAGHRREKRERADRYVTWLCLVLDAHFTSLCVAPAARPVLKALQDLVREEQKVCSRVGSLATEAQCIIEMHRASDESNSGANPHKRPRRESGSPAAYFVEHLQLPFA